MNARAKAATPLNGIAQGPLFRSDSITADAMLRYMTVKPTGNQMDFQIFTWGLPPSTGCRALV